MGNCRQYGLNLTVALGVSVLVGCGGRAGDPVRTTSAALISTSTANVRLQELTNSCGANQAQDFFKVVNAGTTPIPASDVSIKIWVDDTSGSNIVPRIDTGGCLLDGFGSCVHQVTGVTATATPFAPACGPDDHHQANWEITITTTDHTAIGSGLVWSNIQLALHLANFSNFSPGTGRWYSECLSGSGFASVAHAAVYVRGDLVTSSSGVPPSCQAPKGKQPIPGEVPPVVASGAAPLVGPLPGNTPVHLTIGLPLRNQPMLETMIQQVYDPASPQYRKFLTPDRFGDMFGTPSDKYNDLIGFAQSKGLTVVGQYPGRSGLTVTGPASAVEQAFFVTLNEYRRPDGTTFHAPANDPSTDFDEVPVLHISGLDNLGIPKPAQGTGPLGSSIGCDLKPGEPTYAGSDFRTAYLQGIDASLRGAGQTVALVEFDSFLPADPGAYATAFLPGVDPATTVSITSVGAALGPPGSSENEVATDIEMVMAMAPEAQIRVYEHDSFDGDFDGILQQIAKDNVPIISNSWTWTQGTLDTNMPNIFQQFAVQGQAFFQAAGDTGAYDADLGVPEPIILSSLMTVVGGTILTTDASTTLASETTWNKVPNPAPARLNSHLVTGGGFCTQHDIYPTLGIPSYQLGVTGSDDVNHNPSNARMIPDVSMVADQVAIFGAADPLVGKPRTDTVERCQSGTSVSTPLWAALAALINQQVTPKGGGRIGFANPTLYALAAASPASYSSNFNDVKTGNNNFSGTAPATYAATAGYDLATGLGSPTAKLIDTLPPQSCMPGASLTALISGQDVTAYVPNGSWNEPKKGVHVVPIEGAGSAAFIDTDNPVNTCGGNSATGTVVCTANNTDVYIIKGTALTKLSSSATVTEDFSGGSCETCNVAIDPLHNQAFLSIGTQDGAALQPLDLLTQTFGTPIPMGQQATSEDIAIDAVRGLVLSPNEGLENSGAAGVYQLVNSSTGAVFDFSPTGVLGASPVFGFDMAAEDCSTGIALATVEGTSEDGSVGQIFLADLTQATFSGTTWNAPAQFQPIDDFSVLGFGTSAIAVASNSHLGVVSGEFGTATFGVFQLPSKSGKGTPTPALLDWVVATMPDTPEDGKHWQMGQDPHTLTAYTSPKDGKQYAIFEDDADQDGTRTFLAVVDMQALLSTLPRTGSHTVSLAGQTCESATPVAGCVVRYIKIVK